MLMLFLFGWGGMNKIDMTSRDSPTKFCLSLKFHILDGNGVWYCSFWSINLLSMNILVLEPGTSNGSATWDLESRTSNISRRDLEWQRSFAVIQGPSAVLLEVPWCAAIWGPWGQTSWPKWTILHLITIQKMMFERYNIVGLSLQSYVHITSTYSNDPKAFHPYIMCNHITFLWETINSSSNLLWPLFTHRPMIDLVSGS